MKRTTLLFFRLLALALLISACDKDEEPGFALSRFQSTALDYFDDVALGFESGGSSEITRRWESPVRLFVGGEYNQHQYDELVDVINELNSLIEPTTTISIVTDTTQSNSYFHFGSANSFVALFPDIGNSLFNNVGYFNVWWFNDRINRSRIFVDTERLDFGRQKSLIREELVQSLGLGKDSPRFPNSIFYETSTDGGFAESLSDLDREVIRLLYHPLMEVKLDKSAVETAIIEIYMSEALN